MAIGDAADAAGFDTVPDSGSDEARVRWGAREINRTRDYLAAVKAMIPVGKSSYRTASGISSGTADPTGGVDGDIYFKIVSS
jgi:hypothetical protein